MRKHVCSLLLSSLVCTAAELPVKKVVLYKHGVGYFERAGNVPANEAATLRFKTSEMNDVLKSLTVFDGSGARVNGVRYDSNASLTQRLQDFPFQIAKGEKLSAFLDSLRGAHLEVRTSEGAQAGSIVGARAQTTTTEIQEQVTLLLDSGEMANFSLARLTSFRLTDAALQQRLKDYLSITAEAQAQDQRNLIIESAGAGARDLKVSYVTPMAIWKSSYRLSLGATKSHLEGWAIVDNTTDEDWNNVGLAVVSGRPISFISLLDTPRFGNRQVAELPEDLAAGPEVYGATMAQGSGGGVGSSAAPARVFSNNQLLERKANSLSSAQTVQTQGQTLNSTVSGADGATMGELFEYNFAGPVTVKRNQSAMLPFLADDVAARKLLIYTEHDGEHPVNAAEVTNTSGKTLDGGPITVYDGGAYAGEALVETLKAGDKRLIGYAVDYGTRVTTDFETGDQTVIAIHARNGAIEIESSEHDTRTYEIRNVDAKPKILFIEQSAQKEYKIISPKPLEHTASAYRFEVQVPAGGHEKLQVEQDRVFNNIVVVGTATPDMLAEVISGKAVSDAGRKQLDQIIALKRRIAESTDALHANEASFNERTLDETRLRQNIDSLNKVSGQQDRVRQYSDRLNEEEVRLAETRDEGAKLKQTLSTLNDQLTNAIAQLRF